MRSFGPIVASALLLAGCGSAPTTNNTAVAPAPTPGNAGNVAAQVRALPEGQRHGVLFRAVSDAGRACQGVTRAEEAGDDRGRPVWLVTCTDGPQWLVALNADGTAVVSDLQGRPGRAG